MRSKIAQKPLSNRPFLQIRAARFGFRLVADLLRFSTIRRAAFVLLVPRELNTRTVRSRAVALLGADAPTVPIDVVHVRGVVSSVEPAAWVPPAGDRILVNDRSPQYRTALKGDARPLAAVLAHEGCHIAQPADLRLNDRAAAERTCYAVQIATLQALRAKVREIEAVERAARLPR
jgi:hypothetical protein